MWRLRVYPGTRRTRPCWPLTVRRHLGVGPALEWAGSGGFGCWSLMGSGGRSTRRIGSGASDERGHVVGGWWFAPAPPMGSASIKHVGHPLPSCNDYSITPIQLRANQPTANSAGSDVLSEVGATLSAATSGVPAGPRDGEEFVMATGVVSLRAVQDSDLEAFFEQASDPEAVTMAAFPARNADRVHRTLAADGARPERGAADDCRRWPGCRECRQLVGFGPSRGRLLAWPGLLGTGHRQQRAQPVPCPHHEPAVGGLRRSPQHRFAAGVGEVRLSSGSTAGRATD